MTRLPLRVTAWGAAMNAIAPWMHVSRMSEKTIVADQDIALAKTPFGGLLFGRRDPGVTTVDRTIDGPNGAIPLRIYTPTAPAPKDPRPLVLYFHGGGWVLFGGLNACDWLPSTVAARLDAIVVAVDYRLAPQHPFPAGIDDSFAALTWAADNAAHLGASADRIAVMGDSAGGNHSAVMALLARERGGPQLRAQALIYPVTDATLADESMISNATKPVLAAADMHAFVSHYLGERGEHGLATDWRVSPVFANDLSGLPPALVQIAEHDVLHDQGERYARLLVDAATDVTLVDYPGAPHGWVTYPTIVPTAGVATDDLVEFLRARLA